VRVTGFKQGRKLLKFNYFPIRLFGVGFLTTSIGTIWERRTTGPQTTDCARGQKSEVRGPRSEVKAVSHGSAIPD
jgi:hypothetical protein